MAAIISQELRLGPFAWEAAKPQAERHFEVSPLFVWLHRHDAGIGGREFACPGTVLVGPFQDLGDVQDGSDHRSGQVGLGHGRGG